MTRSLIFFALLSCGCGDPTKDLGTNAASSEISPSIGADEKPATREVAKEQSKPAEANTEASETKDGKKGTFPNEKIDVGDKSRAYRLVVPDSVDLKKNVPLLFAFHGLFDSKDNMPSYTELDKLAKQHGFILVYPNGQNRSWPLVLDWAKEDLAFFDALLTHLGATYRVDAKRVYLTGMSNGAYFSNLVAAQRADKIAAIALHSGGLGLVSAKDLQGKRKYPVMIIHGDADVIVNIKEARKTRDAYKQWGHEVEYVEIADLNHFWALKSDINEKIWKFFEKHPRK